MNDLFGHLVVNLLDLGYKVVLEPGMTMGQVDTVVSHVSDEGVYHAEKIFLDESSQNPQKGRNDLLEWYTRCRMMGGEE